MRPTRRTRPFFPQRHLHRPSALKEQNGLAEVTHFLDEGNLDTRTGNTGYAINNTDGKQRMNAMSVEADCMESALVNLLSEACEMDKRSEMDTQFVFFALQAGSVYKQPTDVRDFDMVQKSSVPYHTSREDYKMHGTIVKMPLPCIAASDAIVCHIFRGNDLVAVFATLAECGYENIFSVM